ncbi:RDD family protein [Niabella ginsengisoli]|uniref:RDD family protein n=1 Tax=Niabella ginsengisoli TaxID=522298 RepID=A0ABS9SK19_9BACT|nr:RDD family protein [Niabella ginsengisoli]MCH5598534.1 RDD family protein [Niabella ginsengisoli]
MEPTSNYTNQGESNLFNEQPIAVYGGFWERFGAALIDGIIVGIIGYFIKMIFGSPSTEEIMSVAENEGFSSSMRISYFNTANIVSLVISWLYFALQESSAAQATLGKRALSLKVTGMSGERISFLNATGRHFAKYLSAIILLIGYLMMLWDDKKQTLHDKLAGTLVVKAK